MVLVYWTTLKIVIDRYRYLSTLTEDIMSNSLFCILYFLLFAIDLIVIWMIKCSIVYNLHIATGYDTETTAMSR